MDSYEGTPQAQVESLRIRVEALEAQMRVLQGGGTIAQAPGVDAAGFATETASVDPEVLALLRRGNTIAAIKAYREKSGLELAEAKEAVERIAAAHGL